MNIVILEDSKDRINWFKYKFKDHNVFFTEDIDECLKYVIDNETNILFLDHDLGGKVYVDPDTEYNCGTNFVINLNQKMMEKNDNQELYPKLNDKMQIIVHSMNTPRGEWMTSTLNNFFSKVTYFNFYQLTTAKIKFR